MTIPTPAGDVEVLIGDQFDLKGAKLEVVCFESGSRNVCCRVVSGALTHPTSGNTYTAGMLPNCSPDLVAAQVLLSPLSLERTRYLQEKSPRIPKSSASTKARANKKEKSKDNNQTSLL